MTEPVNPPYQLGRRPPKDAPALLLADILSGVVPAHPVTADHFARVPGWELGANDRFSTCGPTSLANARRQVVAYLAPGAVIPTLADVFDLYRRSGNPAFDPATGADDNGVDMQTMLEALRAGGIGGVRCLAFAKVDVANLDELRAAIDIFGGLLYGVTLDVAQQTQTNAGLWDYKPSATWGGHAILAGRYHSGVATHAEDVAVISWQMIVGTTDDFELHQLEEAWVVIWPEHLGTAEFDAGIDRVKLAAAYEALTGDPFPAAPPPAPVPPIPAPAPVPPPPPPPPASKEPGWLEELERIYPRLAEWLEAHHPAWRD